MKENRLYPLMFKPLLKQKVWGGDKLHLLFGKENVENLGESWEISGVKGNESEVVNGSLAGHRLSELIKEFKGELLGGRVYKKFGSQFPLLFKFIDAQKDLSIQVHPDDTIANKRHDSFGKTEMWYVLQADEDARLILGFKEGITQAAYLKALEEGSLEGKMREVPVKAGDSFYLKPGTVHAIGGGVVLAEIQQSSDVTYRIYDWNRPDTDGNFRELHTKEALDVIDFTTSEEAQLSVSNEFNKANTLCESPYFHTSLIKLSQPMVRNYDDLDSFVVYMCTEGEAVLKIGETSLTIRKGNSLLIPACTEQVRLHTESATILEVYVP